MKKLITLLVFAIFTIGLYAQSGISTFKYEIRAPAIRIGGATKVKLDSIVQNVDTIKFFTGGHELFGKGAGSWTGTGIGLDTTWARLSLRIDQVTNESKAAMFNDPIFTGVSYFGHSAVPTTPGTGYLGVSDNPWAGAYLGATSPLSWGNSVFLQGSPGLLSLSGGNLSLGSNNLLMTGNIGSNGGNINYGYFDSLYVANPIIGNLYGKSEQTLGFWPQAGSLTLLGADSLTFLTNGQTTLTLPTSGTLLTTAVLSGYAPLNAPAFTGDFTVEYIRAANANVALGNSATPWVNLYMSSTGGVIWDASTDIILAPVFGELKLENSPLLIDNNDIGKNIQRVRKGWFTDLESTNRPTVGAAPIALQQDITDSLNALIDNATLGVALADSNAYGGYTTRTYVESLLGSGSGLSAKRLPFIIGVTTGAPSASDSTITHSAFDGKHIDLYRDGAKQYQQFTATNIYEGFRVNGSTITVNPAWQANEQVMVDIIEPILWSYLSLEGQESTLLTGLSGYWKLDETSGTIVTDATGTQNGTTTATVNVAGKLGRAYEFDAAGDIVTIPYNTNISPKGTAFSLAVWFKIDSLPTVTGRGNYLFQQGNNATPYLSHSLEVDNSDNKITARSRNAAGTLYEVRSTAAISVDTWYQLVFVNAGDGTALKIYLNGTDVTASTVTFTGTVFEGLYQSCFGNAYVGAPSSFLDGILDSFGIWSRALTSGEVITLYNSGNGRTYPFN